MVELGIPASGYVHDACFSGDDRYIISCGNFPRVQLFHSWTGKEICGMETGLASSVVFSTDGSFALVGTDTGLVFRVDWDIHFNTTND